MGSQVSPQAVVNYPKIVFYLLSTCLLLVPTFISWPDDTLAWYVTDICRVLIVCNMLLGLRFLLVCFYHYEIFRIVRKLVTHLYLYWLTCCFTVFTDYLWIDKLDWLIYIKLLLLSGILVIFYKAFRNYHNTIKNFKWN